MGMDRYKLMTYQRINYVIHLIIRIKDEKLKLTLILSIVYLAIM